MCSFDWMYGPYWKKVVACVSCDRVQLVFCALLRGHRVESLAHESHSISIQEICAFQGRINRILLQRNEYWQKLHQ